MRFIGSKERLLPAIGKILSPKKVPLGSVVGDLFCGTGSVSAFLKHKGYRVLANDNLFFCTVLAWAKLIISQEPTFTGLDMSKYAGGSVRGKLFYSMYEKVLDYLNDLPLTMGFMYNNYSLEGTKNGPYERCYFTGDNAGRIDSIRGKIEEWSQAGVIYKDEKYLLLTDLLLAIAAVSNTAGTYGFFLKKLEPRAMKKLLLKPSMIVAGRTDHKIFNMDANALARELEMDLAYLDPPYNWRQYAAYYHILETVTKYDKPEPIGKSGLRPWQEYRSRYSNRIDAKEALAEIVQVIKAKAILLSYNMDGLITHDEIMGILNRVGDPEFESVRIPRYISSAANNYKNAVEERLYYVRKQK